LSSAGGLGRSTALMRTLSTFTSHPARWDFTNETDNGTNDYWRMCADGVDYPHLNWESAHGDLACPDGVSFEDLDYFADYWLTNCTSSNSNCSGTDIDFSGTVNFKDFASFAQNWLATE
jgi:hypothetical protein